MKQDFLYCSSLLAGLHWCLFDGLEKRPDERRSGIELLFSSLIRCKPVFDSPVVFPLEYSNGRDCKTPVPLDTVAYVSKLINKCLEEFLWIMKIFGFAWVDICCRVHHLQIKGLQEHEWFVEPMDDLRPHGHKDLYNPC